MSLTERQKRWLKPRVHHLRPVVIIGQAGLTDGVFNEIEAALDHHELIKIKVNAGDRTERDALVGAIAERAGAALIARIGNTAAFFRANPTKKDRLIFPAL